MLSALSSRLGFTHYSFPYSETTYIIIARREVRLEAAVEVGQHAIYQACVHTLQFFVH